MRRLGFDPPKILGHGPPMKIKVICVQYFLFQLSTYSYFLTFPNFVETTQCSSSSQHLKICELSPSGIEKKDFHNQYILEINFC